MRRLACLASVALALAGLAAVAAPGSAAPEHPGRNCGTKWVFQQPFTLRVWGTKTGCAKIRRIVSNPCRIRFKREWSCFSFREDGPFLAWFPSDEVFKRRLSALIAFERYPCSRARVTPSLFSHFNDGFPTRRQLLADDLIRCDMLRGMTAAEVEATIGPGEGETERGRTYLDYGLGPERDSIIQIDDEFLSVELVGDRVRSVEMYQG